MKMMPLDLHASVFCGVVMSMHTRGTLVQFGAEAMIPTLQSVAFFNELGPLVTALENTKIRWDRTKVLG